MTDEQQRCREAYEQWHRTIWRGDHLQDNNSSVSADYENIVTESHWQCWKAAYAAQEQRIKGLVETLGAIGSNSGPKTLDGKELYQLGTAAAMCRQALAQYHAGQKAPASTEDENG